VHKILPLFVLAAVGVLVVNIFKAGEFKVGAADVIDDTPKTKSVALIIFNPILESKGGVRVNTYFNWSDPVAITNQLLSRIPTISHGYLTYNIAESHEVDGYFYKQSGYEFTDETFLACMNRTGPCNGELIDYQRLFTEFDICNKNVDEVWLWGAPWFGYYEFHPVTYCGKTQFVMGFNYERQFDEAMHDFGHRMEFVLNNRVGNGNWQQNEANEFNKFSLINGHCGNIHYPPGSTIGADEYIYNKTSPVTTDCNGYNNYPDGPFVPEQITCSAWGCTQAGYVSWWLSKVPSATGTSTSNDFKTIYNNWWKYYVNYDETAVPLPSPAGTPQPTTPVTFTNLSSQLIPGRATFNFTYTGPTSNFVVDMSLRPDMSWDTYLTFAQGNASPVIEENPEKWASYTCGTPFYWTVKSGYGTSAIQPAVVNCNATPSATPAPTPTPSPVPTPTPVITPTPLADVTLYPLADSYVSRESGKTGTNFGTSSTLQVDGSPIEITYMKYDLTSIATKNVTNATLWIKVLEGSGHNQNLKQTSTSWNETSINYNNKPALSTKIVSFKPNSSGNWKSIDITSYIRSKKGQVVSFAIDSSGSDGADFVSREGADKPYILVK
jgi:hypothetical protein